MIKAIIFDCFGVVMTDALESTYRALGGDPVKDKEKIDDIRWRADKGEVSSVPLYAALVGVSESEWMAMAASKWVVNQELLDYIRDELRKNYRVAMLSNVGKGRLPQIFGEGFLEQYFEEVVASGDIGWAKPEPQAYETVADRLGVRLDECVFTDDREEYTEGAEGVGMHTILFKDFAQFREDLQQLEG